jgi:hypothetical protein
VPKGKRANPSRQRLAEAAKQLPAIRDALAFEQIRLEVRDEGRLWCMKFRNRALLRFWPGSAMSADATGSNRRCTSANAAKRRAIHAKARLLSGIRRALQRLGAD